MKVRVSSKSAVEQYLSEEEGKQMSLLVAFDFLDEHGHTLTKHPTGVLCLKTDFDKYQVGEIYEIK